MEESRHCKELLRVVHLAVLRKLLRVGADVNYPAGIGIGTALQLACAGGHVEVVSAIFFLYSIRLLMFCFASFVLKGFFQAVITYLPTSVKIMYSYMIARCQVRACHCVLMLVNKDFVADLLAELKRTE